MSIDDSIGVEVERGMIMGETATVRVAQATKRELEKASKELGIPQAKVISVALKELRKKMFLNRLADDFARLRKNEQASKEYDEEARDWERLSDGLEEPY